MNAEIAQHLSRAGELLDVARETLDHGHPADSISRSYYAMFHAARAVLLKLGIERKSHHGVWAAFGQFVAAPGLVERRHHRAAMQLFAARIDSDYLPKPGDTPQEAEECLQLAREFVDACQSFLEGR